MFDVIRVYLCTHYRWLMFRLHYSSHTYSDVIVDLLINSLIIVLVWLLFYSFNVNDIRSFVFL